MTRYYAGIGSRQTPPWALKLMQEYAQVLGTRGYTLRSGGADGADTAFKSGAGPHPSDIYLPWAGFNGNQTGIVAGDDEYLHEISSRYHPVWSSLSRNVRRLHTRNAAVILGHTRPFVASDFVLCWTPHARSGGGTGHAIRIAEAHRIPVYDLANPRNGFENRWLGSTVSQLRSGN